MTADDDVPSTGVPTDADIIASITTESNDAGLEDEFDDDVDNCGDEIRPPSSHVTVVSTRLVLQRGG